jgi:hypothetical protein
MSYRFVEHKYPSTEPNIDLNFNNDIIYSDILDDQYENYKGKYENANVVPTNRERKNHSAKNKSSNTIYIIFLFIVIILVTLRYYYKYYSPPVKQSLVDMYPDIAELTLLSPDVGTNAIYHTFK